jgi:hypothetical protein
VEVVVDLQKLLLQEMEVLVVVQVGRQALDLLVLQELNQHNQIHLQFYNMEILEEIKLVPVTLVPLVVVVVPVLRDKQDQHLEQDQEVLVVMEDNIQDLLDHSLVFLHLIL